MAKKRVSKPPAPSDSGPYIHIAAHTFDHIGTARRRSEHQPPAPATGNGGDDQHQHPDVPKPTDWKKQLKNKSKASGTNGTSGKAKNGNNGTSLQSKLASAAAQLSGTSSSHQSEQNPSSNSNNAHNSTSAGAGDQYQSGEVFGMSREWVNVLDRLLRHQLVQVTPLPEERAVRRSILERISSLGRRASLSVSVYGSARTGVILPESDLDLSAVRYSATSQAIGFTVNRPPMPRKSGYSNPDFVNMLREIRRAPNFRDVIPVAHARVPIIKFRDVETQMDIDISFTGDGVTTSEYLVEQFSQPRFELARPLVVLIKMLLRKWDLHDPKEGGLGSFVVSLMVLWYLTVLDHGHWTLREDHPHSPQTARRAVLSGQMGEEFDDFNAHLQNAPGSIAPLLVGFLLYYGEQFPFKTTGIDLAKGATFEKPLASELHLVNPTMPGHNVAAAATRFGPSVRPRFQTVARLLSGRPLKGKTSLAPGSPKSPRAAVETVFGDANEGRWSEARYSQFKQAAQDEAHSPPQTFFRNVILPSPMADPISPRAQIAAELTPLPPPLSHKGTGKRKRAKKHMDGTGAMPSGGAPSPSVRPQDRSVSIGQRGGASKAGRSHSSSRASAEDMPGPLGGTAGGRAGKRRARRRRRREEFEEVAGGA